MRLDHKLNLVIPIERDDGSQVFAHSTPISKLVFDAHYLLIGKAFSAIYTEGLSVITGPRLAANVLRQLIKDSGSLDGLNLLSEMWRLTNIIVPGSGIFPLEQALRMKLLNEDEIAEVEGAITFFTLNSAIHRKSTLAPILQNMCRLWGTLTTSCDATEYAASLQTSTKDESTGETTPTPARPVSAIPS